MLPTKLEWYIGPGIVEFVLLAFGPLVKLGYVHHDLPLGIELNMRAIHWPRGRTLKVDCLAVVTAAVAGALKLVLARLPVRSASEVRTARVDHENPVRSFVHPNAILLLPLGIDTERVVCGKTDAKSAGRLKNGPWQEEPEKHQEAGCQKPRDACPNNSPPHFVNRRIGRALNNCAGARWSFCGRRQWRLRWSGHARCLSSLNRLAGLRSSGAVGR